MTSQVQQNQRKSSPGKSPGELLLRKSELFPVQRKMSLAKLMLLGSFGPIWTYLGLSVPVWGHLDLSGPTRLRLGAWLPNAASYQEALEMNLSSQAWEQLANFSK